MLENIWFFLWGVLWIIYFILDGYDLGLGLMKPLLAKSEQDKRMVYNAMGPFWDGNEVWLLTAGGVTFAAFPRAYAIMFSGLYTALMLLLLALIVRGVAMEFRSKVESEKWTALWDKCLIGSSFAAALLLGVAFANVFMGLPIDGDGIVQGGILDLLNPYGLAGGVLFVLLFALHGTIWLAVRTEGELQERARGMALKTWNVLALVYVLFLVMSALMTNLFDNYLENPALLLLLILPVAGLVGSRIKLAARKWWCAWRASALLIAGTALFGVVGIFPALLPSSLDPAFSVTAQNSSSSPLTLKIMLGVALVVVPIVIIYQIWMHKKFGDTITESNLHY